MKAAQEAGKLTVEKLCRKYDNEDVHTEHVTALALRLFDATRKRLKLPANSRAILEAAGRLHDIAYSVDAADHREKSADIVLREGLAGCTDADRNMIAAVMVLHAGAVPALLRHRLIRRLPSSQRALQLGALLRLADGLDYGHCQDTFIARVRIVPETVRVTVRSSHFPHNVERANQKADLWWSVFPLGVQLVPAANGQDKPAGGLQRGMHVIEAARRLLSLHFKTVLINVDGARTGAGPKPLHDIRVAVRRTRAVLRAFRKPLAETSAERVDGVLRRLNRALGPPRDADVSVAFLTSQEVQKQFRNEPGWQEFVRLQIRRRRQLLVAVRRHLAEEELAALKLDMGHLLRVELPRLAKADPSISLERLARRRLRKEFCRALALAHLRRSKSPEDLHTLRIAMRRVRYLGEFFPPVLGATVSRLKNRVHAMERALARIHDTDVGLQRLAAGRLEPPRSLVLLLGERRREALVRLEETWRHLTQSAFQRAVRRKLKMEL
jgi:CHAD domain-containing protein